MVTGLAHESRNSLQQIHAAVAMLIRRLAPGRETSLLGEITLAHDRLHGLFEAVRGYAAPLELERAVHCLGGLWRAAWEQLAPHYQHRDMCFSEDSGGLELRCLVDAAAIERLFTILLENALHACSEPAAIGIRCRADACDGQAALRVEIRDNGRGLTGAQQQRLFEPFYTTKTKGAGLGLATARRIVEAHGGRISAGAGPGHGTAIDILLPKGFP
jgi:hypothetical protein